jgi:ATP-dependent RNA helicase RhlE
MLFSATMPREIVSLAQQHMKIPIQIEIAPTGSTADNVEQEVFFIEKAAKRYLLEELLKQYQGSVLVFSRTKHGAKKLTRDIRGAGFSAAELHSNRSLAQRREALDGFKAGKYRVLIATDIAARGIDVIGIELVVNFDLPTNTQDYVHRIGRTARAGRAGRAISFATFDQREDIREIERLIRTALAVKQVPALPFDRTPRTQVKYESNIKQKPKEEGPAFGRNPRRPTDREKRRKLR